MMMRSAGGAVAVVVAALLVTCNADPRQEQDGSEHNSGDRYNSGHPARPQEASGHLSRSVREVHHSNPAAPYVIRRYDYPNQYGRAESWPAAQPEYVDGYPKRNFDEIDRSDLDMFVARRNFDEIDQTSMPFPYKRFLHNYHYGSPYMMRDGPTEKRLFKDYPMDEIDLSLFPLGSKRSGSYPHHVLG